MSMTKPEMDRAIGAIWKEIYNLKSTLAEVHERLDALTWKPDGEPSLVHPRTPSRRSMLKE